jgi:hypothetical protein
VQDRISDHHVSFNWEDSVGDTILSNFKVLKGKENNPSNFFQIIFFLLRGIWPKVHTSNFYKVIYFLDGQRTTTYENWGKGEHIVSRQN